MSDELAGKKVAILAANGFEQVELTECKKALEQAGVTVSIVSPEAGKVKGWKTTKGRSVYGRMCRSRTRRPTISTPSNCRAA